MRKAIVLVGVHLIILGILNFIYMSSVSTSSGGMGGYTPQIHPDSYFAKVRHLPKDANVKGTISEVTGGDFHIDFYVFDEFNYNLWKNGHSYTKYVFIDRAGTGATFSFRTDKADDYYFVFHNPLSETNRSAIWSASYECKRYAPYAMPVAIILGVIGVIVIVTGYLAKLKQVEPPPPTVQ